MELHRSTRGLDRLVNFSDAVVAIAITLLVLPLTELIGEAHHSGAFTLVSDNGDQFVAFVLTFLVTAIYWLRHHSTFEMVGSYDNGLLWLNSAWLMLIVLLPFASGLVSETGWADGNGVVYAGTMALLSWLLGLIGVHLRRRPHLLLHGASGAELNVVKAWIFGGFFVVIAVVSVFQPTAASWLLLLLIPLARLTRPRQGPPDRSSASSWNPSARRADG